MLRQFLPLEEEPLLPLEEVIVVENRKAFAKPPSLFDEIRECIRLLEQARQKAIREETYSRTADLYTGLTAISVGLLSDLVTWTAKDHFVESIQPTLERIMPDVGLYYDYFGKHLEAQQVFSLLNCKSIIHDAFSHACEVLPFIHSMDQCQELLEKECGYLTEMDKYSEAKAEYDQLASINDDYRIAIALFTLISTIVGVAGLCAWLSTRNPNLTVTFDNSIEPTLANRIINLAERLNITLKDMTIDALISSLKAKASKVHSRLTFLKATKDVLVPDVQNIILQYADLMIVEPKKI